MAVKYVVEMAGGQRFIARFYPPGREHVANYEPQILLRAHATGVKVPRVRAHSGPGAVSPMAYMFYEWVPGISMDQRSAALSIGQTEFISDQICEELLRLTTLSVTGFGGMIDGDRAQFESWRSMFQNALDEFERIEGYRTDVDFASAARAIGRSLAAFDSRAAPQLCWGDISPDNVILGDDDRLSGLIDFEGVLAAEPCLNLGYAQARYAGTAFGDALARSYVKIFGDDDERSTIYIVLRALRIWPYRVHPLPTGHARQPLAEFLPGLAPAISSIEARLGPEGARRGRN